MPFIGRQPLVGNYIKLDAITTSATTTFNLTAGGVAVYPQTATNCIVSLNGIIQAPTDAYTISGSTIVFASALTTSDVIDFITVLGDVLNIGTPSDGTVSLAKLTATGTKDSTTFLRGDNTFQTIGTNTPAFAAKMTSDQALTNATNTKLNFDNEIFDTNSAYDPTTNYRFTVPSGQGGKYLFLASAFIRAGSVGQFTYGITRIFKNNSAFLSNIHNNNNIKGYGSTPNVILIDNAVAGDYYEVFALGNADAGLTVDVSDQGGCSYFAGFKLI